MPAGKPWPDQSLASFVNLYESMASKHEEPRCIAKGSQNMHELRGIFEMLIVSS